ncbi:MAG: SagB/ThcOx family dehydrogenase [Tenericutes bacterium]|nr:SagB/ThcOx family dehydrogenase [Mycoplasmatota bacterium]
MKLNQKQIDEFIKSNRECLLANWNLLDNSQTPRGQNLEKPSAFKSYATGEILELKKDVNSLSSRVLDDIIMSRRSLRKYQDVLLSLDELSYLMKCSAHIRKIGDSYALGVIPTGGARNSLETYIYLRKAENITKGLYHYMKDTGNLRLIREEVTDALVDSSLKGQLRDCAAVVIWTAIPYRMEYKYSFTSHKMIAIEAGHACQNLYLACEAIDYGMVALCAYDQEKIDEVVRVGNEEFVVYCATLGKK